MAKFLLGSIVTSEGIAFDLNKSKALRPFINNCLSRHIGGDWGNLCEEDKSANDEALKVGDRIVSKYEVPLEIAECIGETAIYIITEWDRSATTVFYTSEY